MKVGDVVEDQPGNRRRLGRTGVLVSPIGLGCWQFSRGQGLVGRFWPALDDDTERAIVGASIEGGVNWFDTAEVYGGGVSERGLSRALRSLGVGHPDVVIATKWFPLLRPAGHIGRSLPRRLEALGGLPIGLHQIHHWSSISSVKSQMNAMADLVDQDRIGAVGVSNFSARAMTAAHAALARRGIPLASNQVRYSLLARAIESNGILDAAKRLGVTIIAYSPLAQGILSGKFHDDPSLLRSAADPRRRMPSFSSRALARARPLVDLLRAIGREHDATPAQVALSWIIRSHGETVVAIPGARTVTQARGNAQSMRLALSPEELDGIDRVSRSASG